MTESDASQIAVHRAPARWEPWWAASSALFILATLTAAFRSMPGNLSGTVLQATNGIVTVAFTAALICAAVALSVHPWAVRARRSVSIALVILAIWVVVGPPLLLLMFGDSNAVPMFADALVKLVLGGVAVSGLLRSTLAAPWRSVPAIALAAVVLAGLMGYFMLSGAVDDMNAIFVVINVADLTRTIATGALAAVSLHAARSRADSVVVFGGEDDV
ncbi:hypothetical protein ACIQTT_10370 [Microbacterium sp. NPDC090225]|uniref:hypothetical protein n=1 Tax=Microbacterium sp. NPDC090225 TaxID=3364207 RepID=UPI00381F15DB